MFDEYALKLAKQMIPGKEDWVYDKLVWEIPFYPFADQHQVKKYMEEYQKGFEAFGDSYTPWVHMTKHHLLLLREGQVVLKTNATVDVIKIIFDNEPPRTAEEFVEVLKKYGFIAYRDEVEHTWTLR
ncbi:hypothetical protein_gp019 [Bacillus phage vB_BceM_WH1]|nr:hypothetical protein_gp019 [Bacillus phage vB_BceM_WH1]